MHLYYRLDQILNTFLNETAKDDGYWSGQKQLHMEWNGTKYPDELFNDNTIIIFAIISITLLMILSYFSCFKCKTFKTFILISITWITLILNPFTINFYDDMIILYYFETINKHYYNHYEPETQHYLEYIATAYQYERWHDQCLHGELDNKKTWYDHIENKIMHNDYSAVKEEFELKNNYSDWWCKLKQCYRYFDLYHQCGTSKRLIKINYEKKIKKLEIEKKEWYDSCICYKYESIANRFKDRIYNATNTWVQVTSKMCELVENASSKLHPLGKNRLLSGKMINCDDTHDLRVNEQQVHLYYKKLFPLDDIIIKDYVSFECRLK